RVYDLAHFNRQIAPFFPTRDRPYTRRVEESWARPAAPTFAHEVLAHWLFHRAVTWVVDFNFDELLLTALDDEAGPDGAGTYRFCATLSDFSNAADDIDNRGVLSGLAPYRVFKPHGTMSIASSLMKTDAEIAEFGPGTKPVLSAMFSHSVEVVILGYACRDQDFVNLLKELENRPLRYLVVARNPAAV